MQCIARSLLLFSCIGPSSLFSLVSMCCLTFKPLNSLVGADFVDLGGGRKLGISLWTTTKNHNTFLLGKRQKFLYTFASSLGSRRGGQSFLAWTSLLWSIVSLKTSFDRLWDKQYSENFEVGRCFGLADWWSFQRMMKLFRMGWMIW